MIQKRIGVFLIFLVLAGTLLFLLFLDRETGPNILLISVDTTRADRLGCYGYAKGDTPHINRLAQRGILFSNTISPAPITLPSHASLLTGTYPIHHGVRNNGTFRLMPNEITIAESLKERGYKTGAVLGAVVLESRYGLDQGFSQYDDNFKTEGLNIYTQNPERTAGDVTRLALEWLRKHGDSTFFLFLHYFDPHFPYTPPSPFRERYQEEPYDGELAYVDHSLGRLLHGIREMGLEDNTLIVLTSDHGESLGEHGEKSHGVFAYDASIRVPLILAGPEPFSGGKTIEEQVRLVDIVPTLLGIVESPIPPQVQGKSFLSLIDGKDTANSRKAFFESYAPRLNYGWAALEGVRVGEWKFIDAPKPELYHLSSDPEELKNLFESDRDRAMEMKGVLRDLRKTLEPPEENRRGTQELAMNQRTLEQLKLLGYTWEESRFEFEDGKRPDPKDMMEISSKIELGESYYQAGAFEEAFEIYSEVAEKNPKNQRAWYIMGQIYMLEGRKKKAKECFLKALGANPHYVEVYTSIGQIYFEEGNLDQAEKAYLRGVECNPLIPELHFNLGLVRERRGNIPRAKMDFKKALQLDPQYLPGLVTMGRISLRERDKSDALEYYERAVALNPPPAVLAEIAAAYLQLGEEGKHKECMQKIGEQQRRK